MPNSRLGTVNNLTPATASYPAETYDLNFLSFGSFPYPSGQIIFDFGNEPTRITGIQKVVQLFLKCFLSPKGSDIINSAYGTNYGSMLQNNAPNFSSNTQALSVIQPSIEDATGQVASLTASNPPESVLQSVVINGIVFSGGGTSINLYVETAAGVGAQIAVPQPQLNLTLSA